MEPDADEGPEPRADDPTLTAARADLRGFFEQHPKEVFYDRQLCVLFEKQYFHWITSSALRELAAAGQMATDLEIMPDLRDEYGKQLTLRFYRDPSHRYWLRQRNEIASLVRRFAGEFGHALGDYGELVCDAGLGGAGFVRAATNARDWEGRSWTRTEHNLDRIYKRDGIAYGCEIKNTLKYLPVTTRQIKTAMCEHLGIVPLFIVRWLPKSHMYDIIQAGGFAILFEHQLYPIGQEKLAREVRERLGLPVVCRRDFPPDAVARFVKLHERRVEKRGR
jgi:hypothetical protein